MKLTNTKNRINTIIIIAMAVIALSGCSKPEPPQTKQRLSAVGFYMDTIVRIEAYDTNNQTLDELIKKCGEYEALLSKTIPGSDVYKLNNANGNPVEVSHHTIAILKKAIEVSSLSKGKFDITIAPLSALWDFTTPVIPDKAKLDEALPFVDYTKIIIDNNTVTLPKGVMIDLGGIAKGYIADEIARLFEEKGIKSGLLNFGGNVVAIGKKPDGSLYNIGLQNPDEPTGAYFAAVESIRKSIVTSGNYERGFDLDGIRYHHILEPSTGFPINNELSAVTILSDSSMEADALSTACFALGIENGMKMLEANYPDVMAIFIKKDLSIITTNGLDDYLALNK